jgi:hypothetical protein
MADSTAPADPAAQNHADRPVYVIGGGPGGLAAAYALRAQGVRAVVLEKSDRVGASWRRHYDRLHLHTTRRLSGLPGLRCRAVRALGLAGRRGALPGEVRRVHELEIVTGVEVSRVERSADGTGWLLHATGGRELTGSAVVVATGTNHTPRIPDWPGRDAYTGELLHAGEYRNPSPTPAGTSSSSASATPVPRSPSTWWRAAPRAYGSRSARPAHRAPVDGRLGGPVHGHSRTTAAGRPRRPARRADGQGQRAGPVGAGAAAPRHRAVQPRQRGARSPCRTSA